MQLHYNQNCSFLMNIQQFCLDIESSRFYYMGIAMLFVIFYHLYCILPSFSFFSLFKFGYIGVDIFLFFSGFGLCFSYTKNTKLIFYKNRIFRIYPLYLIWAFVHAVFILLYQGIDINLFDIMGLITTLSYYGLGKIRANWYLSALFLLYTCFPLFFLLVNKFREISILLFSLLLPITVLHFFNFEWYHEVFICRLFPFISGIYCYLLLHENTPPKKSEYCRIFILFMILFILGSTWGFCIGKYPFLIAGTTSIGIIFILWYFKKKIIKCGTAVTTISIFGKYSLEFFIGNCWTMLLIPLLNDFNKPFHNCTIYTSIIYLLSNIVFTWMLIQVNTYIQNNLLKLNK